MSRLIRCKGRHGKLTKSKRAAVITALLSEFDDNNLIYEDAEDMGLFLD